MTGWVWTVVVLGVLAALTLAALESDHVRRNRLQRQFGPEYDRAVARAEGRRAAEAQLQDRIRRRSRLTIVPLPEEVAAAYVQRWRAVQEEFVDLPRHAVATAELLVHRVMAERGYPVAGFEELADLVSVDHPQVVEDYRVAHAIQRRQGVGEVTTDDLREALVRYRSLFDELLRDDQEAADDDRVVVRAGSGRRQGA
jgi:hypothetical protein